MTPLHRRQLLRLAAGAVAISSASRTARAQSYPTRPVRVIVPFAPGGTTDIFARLLTQKLSQRLGKSFYVDNIAGASGNIGTGQAARSAPDGYTIFVAFASFVINPSMFDKVPYDPQSDFEPVTLAVTSTNVLTVNPSVPAKTVEELVALIKANPGKYSFASPGAGTPSHLVGEMLRKSRGLDLAHIPYNGAGPAIAAVVAGHVPVGVSTLATAAPYINDGQLRSLAVTSKMRSLLQPDVPTMTEAGYPDIEGESWVGVLVPTRTSADIITLLHRNIAEIVELPDMRERLAAVGFEAVGGTPEQFAKQIKFEIENWGKIIREAKIRVE
jgi:tripartite-type tricarboxylate transporter receptor subunit TctC